MLEALTKALNHLRVDVLYLARASVPCVHTSHLPDVCFISFTFSRRGIKKQDWCDCSCSFAISDANSGYATANRSRCCAMVMTECTMKVASTVGKQTLPVSDMTDWYFLCLSEFASKENQVFFTKIPQIAHLTTHTAAASRCMQTSGAPPCHCSTDVCCQR